MSELLEAARAWAAGDPDEATRAELLALAEAAEGGDEAAAEELADAFRGLLQFGTAGLRGAIGAGPNRMNRVVVSQAAAGLAAYLLAQGHAGAKVLVGYDARYNSDVFAREEFRRINVLDGVASHSTIGKGWRGYLDALDWIIENAGPRRIA